MSLFDKKKKKGRHRAVRKFTRKAENNTERYKRARI